MNLEGSRKHKRKQVLLHIRVLRKEPQLQIPLGIGKEPQLQVLVKEDTGVDSSPRIHSRLIQPFG